MRYKLKNLFQYASDLHLERGFKREIIPKTPNLILGGDIGYVFQDSYEDFLLNKTSPYFDRVFVLSGNHEYDNCENEFSLVDERIENICSKRNNLVYLQKKSYVLSENDNISLMGCTLWSDRPKSKIELHRDHKLWISNMLFENPHINYVVATHHCPLFECIGQQHYKRIPNYFASDQSKLVSMSNVIQWIHGHSHMNRDFLYKNKWIVSNQYGSFEKPCYGYKI
jgi:hypothetical protein